MQNLFYILQKKTIVQYRVTCNFGRNFAFGRNFVISAKRVDTKHRSNWKLPYNSNSNVIYFSLLRVDIIHSIHFHFYLVKADLKTNPGTEQSSGTRRNDWICTHRCLETKLKMDKYFEILFRMNEKKWFVSMCCLRRSVNR